MKSLPEASRLSPRKAAAFRLLAALVVLGVLLAIFAAAELVLRLRTGPPVADPSEAPAGQLASAKHPQLGWIFPPSTEGVFRRGAGEVVERTNRWGLRSPEIDAADSLVTRILVTGDSFAFGWGVLEGKSFPRRLEAMLRERFPGRRIEVVNAGIPGYSLYQQRAMLERMVGGLRLDAVVSTFSLSNDMVDEVRIRRFAPDRLVQYSPRPRDADSALSRLIERSRVLTWIDLRTRGAQFQLWNVLPGSVRDAEESLGEIVRFCREKDLPLLLVLLPRRAEVEGEGISATATRWATRGARRMFAGVAGRESVPTVDVTAAVAAVQAREPAYLPDDPHWSPAGNEAVAALLVEPVAGLLPGRP